MNFLKASKTITKISRNMGYAVENRDRYWLDRIGTREIVGYGLNGQPLYIDRHDYPCPAIRWKESTPEVQSLTEKAKGDWRMLLKEEKKALYRASFCQTYAEISAHYHRGDWAEPIGITLILCSLGIWLFIYMQLFVYEEWPDSFSEPSKRAQMRRQLDLKMNPVTGLASKFDYDRMDWKRVTWDTPPNPFVKCLDDADD